MEDLGSCDDSNSRENSNSAAEEEGTALVQDDIDYSVSIRALRFPTRHVISSLLNPEKIFLTDSGMCRDWQGLAALIGITNERIPSLQSDPDPTQKVLNFWSQNEKTNSTVQQLLQFFEQLDRFDIIDDIRPLVEEDVKLYKQEPHPPNKNSCIGLDKYILTRDDLNRIEEGLSPQQYDAFVLFADDDIDFATQLIDQMENQYKLKLCVKDRDLVVGVFEHESIITLIAERCHRLVAIISPAFLESSANKFFLSFAQAIGIEHRQRKIIPCLYISCPLPPELSCYFMLDYKRSGKFWNFWEKLRDSIRTPTPSKQIIYRSSSQKLPAIEEYCDGETVKPENSLKPQKERVKFNSMGNLNQATEFEPIADPNLNPSSSANSLEPVSAERKKKKAKTHWFKNLLHKKEEKSNVIQNGGGELEKKSKKHFWNKHLIKRKLAIAS